MLAAWSLLVSFRKPLLILAALVALWAGYGWWEAKVEARGEARAEERWMAREKAIEAAAKDKYVQKLEEALTRQRALQTLVDNQTADRADWEKKHETAASKRIAAALADNDRLRVQVRAASRALPGVAVGEATSAAAPPGAAEEADLMPGVAAAVLRIAGDSARTVRDYNDLLGRYQGLEAACK